MNQDESITYAKKYIEDILAFFEINVEAEVALNEDVLEIAIPSTEYNSILIGRNAETLRSIQYLLSTTLRNKDSAITRVNVDIAGYKKQRAEKVAEQAREWIEAVRASGDSHVVSLNAADRRVVHQVATEFDDIQTFSEGEGRDRKIIIAQKSS
jgi:spoIIIJ-associated protein